MKQINRVALWLLPALILITTLLGPAEKSLGDTARIIYLHGAMVWAAMLTFVAAATLGAAGLLLRRIRIHNWSRAAGRAALLFWIGYLPLSMWAASAAWGRVFLDDPSFQKAFRILAVALIVQVTIWLRPRPAWLASALNIIQFAFMALQLSVGRQLMHPDSPIGDSESTLIRAYFYLLTALCAGLAWAIGHWLRSAGPDAKTDERAKIP